MPLQFTLFITIALLIVFGINSLIYLTLTRLGGLVEGQYRTILAIIMALLSYGFIAFSILSRYSNNIFIKTGYAVTGAWWGILLLMFFGSLLICLLFIILKFIPLTINFKILTWIITIITLLASTYGLVNARGMKIVEQSIAIDNLPAGWENKRIIQISDLHLGILNGHTSAKKIITQINHLRPDLVIITGDYFDGTSPDLDYIASPLALIQTRYGVIMINGNHETYVGPDKIEAALKPFNVSYLRNEIIELDGLYIVGLDYPARNQKIQTDILEKLGSDKPSILLYHEPKFIEKAKAAGIDLQLVGHTHGGQIWPFNYITWLVYGKYTSGLHKIDNYNLYVSPGTGTWGPPMRLGSDNEITVFTLKNK